MFAALHRFAHRDVRSHTFVQLLLCGSPRYRLNCLFLLLATLIAIAFSSQNWLGLRKGATLEPHVLEAVKGGWREAMSRGLVLEEEVRITVTRRSPPPLPVETSMITPGYLS